MEGRTKRVEKREEEAVRVRDFRSKTIHCFKIRCGQKEVKGDETRGIEGQREWQQKKRVGKLCKLLKKKSVECG